MEPLQMNEKTAPELPQGWMWAKVDSIIDIIPLTGIKLKQKEYQEEGKMPVIDQGQAFIGGYTDKLELKVNSQIPVIIFGDHTKTIKFVDFDFVAGADGVKVIKPHGVFDPKLFFYFLQAIKLPDKGYARHFQFLAKSQIHVPPFPEQHRIVTKIEELFTQLDAGVASLKKTQAQLKQYRQSVLKSACEGKLVPTEAKLARAEERKYEPADVLLERILKERRAAWEEEQKRKGKKSAKYKEPAAPDVSGLYKLPEGWRWATVGELGVIGEQAVLTGPFGSNLGKKDFRDTGVPLLTIGCLQKTGLSMDKALYIEE